MPTIFLAHRSDANGKAKAVKFRELLLYGTDDMQVFLSSDWESIPAGAIWLQNIEEALATHSHFIALLSELEDAKNPWICYEVGYARGRGLLPKIFVVRGVLLERMPMPLAGIHLISADDTNRWIKELQAMGVCQVESRREEFAELLGHPRKVGCSPQGCTTTLPVTPS